MATPPTSEFLSRMTSVFIRLNDDNEGTRQSALSGLRGMLSTADVDPRELTLLHAGSGVAAWPERFEDEWDKREQELRDRWAVMHPEAHKMRAQIDALEADNKDLKEQLRGRRSIEKRVEKAEALTASATERADKLAKELAEVKKQREDNWAMKTYRDTIENLAPARDKAPMLESEVFSIIESAFPGTAPIEILKRFGFRDGLPTNIPVWFRVFLRSVVPRPLPTPKPKKFSRKPKQHTPMSSDNAPEYRDIELNAR